MLNALARKGGKYLRLVYQDPRQAWRYPWLYIKRRIRNERMIVVVGTAHRVGSTWLFNMLSEIGCFENGLKRIPVEYRELDTIRLDQPGVYKVLGGLKGYFIFKSHSYPAMKNPKRDVKIVTIYRDPRDVIVSTAFYLSHLEEKKGGWGETLSGLPEHERIKVFINQEEFSLSRLEQWYRTPMAYKISYESLQLQPLEVVKGVVGYLGIQVNERTLENVVSKYSFERMSGRKSGEEVKGSPMRKGIIGDWKNYFDPEIIAEFKKAKEGRWNRLLLEMGYERDLDW